MLAHYRVSNLLSCENRELVDLRSVSVNEKAAPRERLQSFINQVKNPYLFKVGDISVAVSYAVDGKPLDSSLQSVLNASS